MNKIIKPKGFIFHPHEWLGDGYIMNLSLEEQGALIRLMCIAWQDEDPCSIPNDDDKLSRLLLINKEEWLKIKNNVLKNWELNLDNRYVLMTLKKTYKAGKAEKTIEDGAPLNIWSLGIDILKNECDADTARKMIGKWNKTYGEGDVVKVLSELSLKRDKVADKIPYITKTLATVQNRASKRKAPPPSSMVL